MIKDFFKKMILNAGASYEIKKARNAHRNNDQKEFDHRVRKVKALKNQIEIL